MDDGADLGQEEVPDAGEGEIEAEAPISGVQKGGDGIDHAVDCELFELGLEEVGWRESCSGKNRSAYESAEEVAGG